MTTLAALTLDVEQMLYGTAQVERPVEDTLSTQVSAQAGGVDDVAWRMTTYTLWKRGDYAEVVGTAGAASEIVILTDDHGSGADVTVRRAQRGSTLVTSAIAAGTVVRKNPAHDRTTVQRIINEVIDTQLWPHVWYRSKRTITDYDPNNTYYSLNAYDFGVEDVFQIDLTPEALPATCSFAQATDVWTCTAHGLSVGDHVRFTDADTNPPEYAADTDYWVLSTPTADTFTLGTAAGASSALDGSVNSGSDWTGEKRLFSYHPFPAGWWEPITDFPGTSTYRALRVRTVHDSTQTIHYVARSKPDSAAVTSIPDELAEMIPWGACWMLLGGTRGAARRHDRRALREGENESQVYADASYFKQTFLDMRAALRRQLLTEKKPRQRWLPSMPRRG